MNEDIITDYNGWSTPETFHFYNWLTEEADRYTSALECESITEMKHFFRTQDDIPNGIDLNEVNWFELWDTINSEQ
jgi:hypothetical protein